MSQFHSLATATSFLLLYVYILSRARNASVLANSTVIITQSSVAEGRNRSDADDRGGGDGGKNSTVNLALQTFTVTSSDDTITPNETTTMVAISPITSSTASTTESTTVANSKEMVKTTPTESADIQVANTTTTTTAISSIRANMCTIRVGFLWWKKVKIPLDNGYFNAKKCQVEYCTSSLQIQSFTCKNLLAMIVPPVSTEDLVNEWKLECAKHKCVPTD